ncbi:MAG: SIS domain-containing protein [Candidatus Helarchaeota archaeon]
MTEIGKYTLREIEEQPEVVEQTLKDDKLYTHLAEEIKDSELIILTGSGSSFNAGFASLYLFNGCGQIPTWVVHSSEFPYLIRPILKKSLKHLLIAISQSGESPGTVAAAQYAKTQDIPTIAVTAHSQSPLAKQSSMILPLQTGEERSVMATKTYMAQIAALSRLALALGQLRDSLPPQELNLLINDLKLIPDTAREMLSTVKQNIKEIAPCYKFVKHAFILGSGPDYATAMEAALKLKEGARILAEAYSAPEFRHGPITLADEYTMILALIPHSTNNRFDSVNSLLKKVEQRHSSILGITPSQDLPYEFLIKMPRIHEELTPLLNIIPIQYLVWDIAILRGYNPDKPQFLTKVVHEE